MSPRISAELSAAQLARVRETGLKVAVRNDPTAEWEYLAGETIQPSFFEPVAGDFSANDLEYYLYRGFAGMALLDNGNIYRVRLGNPADNTDRKLYAQTITAPGTGSQWETWAQLYSGNHYGTVAVKANGSSPIVYHAKSDGIYRNNVKQWEPAAAAGKAFGFIPIENQLDAGWVIVLLNTDGDPYPTFDLWYTPDLTSDDPERDHSNYRWRNRPALIGLLLNTGKIARLQSGQIYHDSRDLDHGTALWYQEQTSLSNRELSEPRVLRGIGGGAGQNRYTSFGLLQASDGFYYLHAGESYKQIVDGVEDYGTNLGLLRTWSRSKDLVNWTEASVGPGIVDSNGFAGVVEVGGFVYWADNGQVWRRPADYEDIQIEDFIPAISFEIPPENQEGRGEATVANPDGVNDWLLELSDRQLIIEPGLKVATGSFEFSQFGPFNLRYCTRQIDGEINRIKMIFGDPWSRLGRPLKDTFNFVGRLNWRDWSAGKRNKAFNYYFDNDSNPTQGDHLTTNGLVIFTGWKGHNPDVAAKFISPNDNPALILRYTDSNNYIRVRRAGGELRLHEIIDGEANLIDSANVSGPNTCTIRAVLKWNRYWLYFNDVEVMSGQQVWKRNLPGYVGFLVNGAYELSHFELEDWEYNFKLSDLIQTALALADFHDVSVSGANEKAYALIWGPNTDLPTAADALRQLMVGLKLQLAYRDNQLVISKFTDQSIIHDLNNLIISTDEENENQQRINVAVVDGNEHFWIHVDAGLIKEMNYQAVAKFDLPELLDLGAVKARAQEEITNGNKGQIPSGLIPLLFDLWRMDFVLWTDNAGNQKLVRVEGYSVEINQSRTPFQRMKLTTGLPSNDLYHYPAGIESAEAFGNPTLAITGNMVISPTGIASAEAVGTPTRS